MRAFQQTLGQLVEITGLGLHTGQEVTMRFLPAEVDHGIVFVRIDIEGTPEIPARIECLTHQPRRTTLARGDVKVQTVEHLLAAFAGLGVDNVRVELDGSEVPGGDGSAREFVRLIHEAGIVCQEAVRAEYLIKKPIFISENDISLVALPCAEQDCHISYTLDYPGTALGSQHCTYCINPETFAKEIADARTFCLASEVESLREQGLGKGASYENTLVFGEKGVEKNTLRYSDECARHKILDIIGDLSLLPIKIRGHIIALKSGHSANAKLAKILWQNIQDGGSSSLASQEGFLSVEEVQAILPHRYPFLMVDRMISLEKGKRAVGLKNITINEEFFQGHFPGKYLMPGVLQVEAMAQVGGAIFYGCRENLNKLAYLVTIDRVKLRKPVTPGDQLIIVAEALQIRERAGRVSVLSFVEGEVVAEAEMKFILVDAERM